MIIVVFVIIFIDFDMDLSTFWKVLWLISFCNFFDVIAIFLLFWLIS